MYLDRISNIVTVCEGNEQDELDDLTQREGVASTNAVCRATSSPSRLKALPLMARCLQATASSVGTRWAPTARNGA